MFKRLSWVVAFCVTTSLLIGTAFAAEKAKKEKKEKKKEKWTVLFDGKSTEAFRGYTQAAFPEKGWKVEDGILKTVKGTGGDIVTKLKYENLDLRFEWKVTEGANSGVMYHVAEDFDAPYMTGIEYQVLDDAKHADGKNPKTSAAAAYALIAPVGKELKPVGEWNEARIIVNGKHVENWLNGKKVVEYELDSPELKALIAASKFKDMPRFSKEKTGYIDFQHHGDEVWYRNIKVREPKSK